MSREHPAVRSVILEAMEAENRQVQIEGLARWLSQADGVMPSEVGWAFLPSAQQQRYRMYARAALGWMDAEVQRLVRLQVDSGDATESEGESPQP